VGGSVIGVAARWRLRGRHGSTVRVHLANAEPSVEGTLRGVHGGHVVLEDAILLAPGGEKEPLRGLVEIPLSSVAFRQRFQF